MHIPLIIAVLALLAFALLPMLDRYANPEAAGSTRGVRAYAARIARWARE